MESFNNKKKKLLAYNGSLTILLLFLVLASAPSLLQAANDNCNGSGLCGNVNPDDCRTAISRYTDGHTYSQYTSRVSGHCTAIYQCSGFYPSLTGANLKEQFLHVYNNQPCKKCGSHAFYGGNCQATLNYCGNCRDSGDPN